MREQSAIPVLMYHSIDGCSTSEFRRYAVDPSLFAEQMAALSEAGCTTLTATQVARVRSGSMQRPSAPVALTFDDGFRDFADNALPVLRELSLTATLFVPTGFVGSSSRWLVAEREQQRALLTWAEIAALPATGVEVAGHGHTHQQMDLLTARRAAKEIALCKAMLEDNVQEAIRTFAYPFGYSSRRVRELVRSQGFEAAFMVADLCSSDRDDRFGIPRLTVTPDTTPEQVQQLLGCSRHVGDVIASRSRGFASRALRTARLRKRENAPERAPGPAVPC